ncbi:hypothetical protein SAMN02745163_00486 [Clostridium cavendishii DSM 21758]|uniref:Uncharacterized protein n=1 Tax=Clostridium cavendishii DSM 21758 TaxID=1121302 RepID=A0A1M6CK64_9CLOT|nr:hypothetical protein SAMN02745163_00486 [Clostridium cavendishii DSM 21758]
MLFFHSINIIVLRRLNDIKKINRNGVDINMKNMKKFLKPVNLNCFNSRWSLWEWTVEFLLTGK